MATYSLKLREPTSKMEVEMTDMGSGFTGGPSWDEDPVLAQLSAWTDGHATMLDFFVQAIKVKGVNPEMVTISLKINGKKLAWLRVPARLREKCENDDPLYKKVRDVSVEYVTSFTSKSWKLYISNTHWIIMGPWSKVPSALRTPCFSKGNTGPIDLFVMLINFLGDNPEEVTVTFDLGKNSAVKVL